MKILLIGDSLSLPGGPGERLEKKLEARGHTVARVANGGKDYNYFAKNLPKDDGYQLVIVFLGTNDAANLEVVNLTKVEERRLKSMQKVKDAYPSSVVVALGPPAFPAPLSRKDKRDLNPSADLIFKALLGVFPAVIDLRPMTQEILTPAQGRAGDGVHFAAEGAEALADLVLAELLRRAGSEEGLPAPTPTPTPTPQPSRGVIYEKYIVDKHGEAFLDALIETSKTIGVPINILIAIIEAESGFSPSIVNKDSGASGLIQWLVDEKKITGFTKEQIRTMSAIDQLPLIVKYYEYWKKLEPVKGADLTDLNNAYHVVYSPGNIGKARENWSIRRYSKKLKKYVATPKAHKNAIIAHRRLEEIYEDGIKGETYPPIPLTGKRKGPSKGKAKKATFVAQKASQGGAGLALLLLLVPLGAALFGLFRKR